MDDFSFQNESLLNLNVLFKGHLTHIWS